MASMVISGQVFRLAPRVLLYPVEPTCDGTNPLSSPGTGRGSMPADGATCGRTDPLSAAATGCGSAPAHPTPAPAVGAGDLALAQFGPRPGESAVFGDGSHPTTRLCAGALDFLCRTRQPRTVLDVGTGTGVLARIARARGAAFVVGTDIDGVALASARAHAALDRHSKAIHLGTEAPDHWGACFSIVVANILLAPLQSLAGALSRALAPAGVLLLSGITLPEVPALRVSYERVGLKVRSESHLDEWALLSLEHA